MNPTFIFLSRSKGIHRGGAEAQRKRGERNK
jgi:hypothetical protein